MTEPLDALALYAATASAEGHSALHLADAALALEAGLRTSEGQALRRFSERIERSPLQRAQLFASALRLTEIDDIHRPSAVTAGAIALPAVLAMRGVAPEAETQRLGAAFHVGQELSIRLAMALGGAGLLTKGLWPSYLVAPFGAAAAAGRVLGLSAERMRHALALALSQTPQAIGRSVGARPGRWLLFGNAVRAGCLAALAAADGIDGDPGLLTADWLVRSGGPPAPDWLTVEMPLSAALSIKPHAAAKQTLAAIEGLRWMLADGIDPGAIETIEVAVPRAYAAMVDREPPDASRIASLISLRGQLALTALRPDLLDDVGRARFVWDAALQAFAARVTVVADPDLDALYPACWPARLRLRARGREREILVADSPGDPALPYGPAELEDKARRVLGDAGPALARLALDALTAPAAFDRLCRHVEAGLES
jgi:2-methylcitrate dehydratase PrpD